MQIIRKNFALKVLAVCLADRRLGVLSFCHQSDRSRRRVSTQQISVPIAAVNLAAGYVAHFTDQRSRRHGRNEARRTGDQTRRDQSACSIFRGKPPGVYNVPVALVAPEVVDAEPQPRFG